MYAASVSWMVLSYSLRACTFRARDSLILERRSVRMLRSCSQILQGEELVSQLRNGTQSAVHARTHLLDLSLLLLLLEDLPVHLLALLAQILDAFNKLVVIVLESGPCSTRAMGGRRQHRAAALSPQRSRSVASKQAHHGEGGGGGAGTSTARKHTLLRHPRCWITNDFLLKLSYNGRARVAARTRVAARAVALVLWGT